MAQPGRLTAEFRAKVPLLVNRVKNVSLGSVVNLPVSDNDTLYGLHCAAALEQLALAQSLFFLCPESFGGEKASLGSVLAASQQQLPGSRGEEAWGLTLR